MAPCRCFMMLPVIERPATSQSATEEAQVIRRRPSPTERFPPFSQPVLPVIGR